jgi:glycosyltransferase involved in cell wall biosynthesis
MKKVLIITDTFPPYKHIGRFRIQQFAKFLPQFGWEPIILTPTSSYLWEKDVALEKEIPKNLKVFRPFLPPTLPVIIRNITNMFRAEKKIGEPDIPTNTKKNIKKSSIIKIIVVFIINTFNNLFEQYILIPGKQILWLPFAIAQAVRIIKKYDVDVIFSSVPVYSNHIVACMLKILTQKSWVADYRDLWANDITRMKRFSKFRGYVERLMEKCLLPQMDLIIFVSAMKVLVMKNEYPNINFNNIAVLPNGFDPYMLLDSKYRYKRNAIFEIVYTGRITAHRHHNKFLYSIGLLLNERPDLKKVLKLKFIGKISEREKQIFDEITRKYFLEKNISYVSWLDHKKISKIQREADLLLLIVDDVKFAEAILPGKVFEYIVANRPILTLAPDGDTKNIIIETNTGIVVPPKDIQQISEAIIQYYKKWKANELYINPNWIEINKYNREKLTEKLTQFLNKLS